MHEAQRHEARCRCQGVWTGDTCEENICADATTCDACLRSARARRQRRRRPRRRRRKRKRPGGGGRTLLQYGSSGGAYDGLEAPRGGRRGPRPAQFGGGDGYGGDGGASSGAGTAAATKLRELPAGFTKRRRDGAKFAPGCDQRVDAATADGEGGSCARAPEPEGRRTRRRRAPTTGPTTPSRRRRRRPNLKRSRRSAAAAKEPREAPAPAPAAEEDDEVVDDDSHIQPSPIERISAFFGSLTASDDDEPKGEAKRILPLVIVAVLAGLLVAMCKKVVTKVKGVLGAKAALLRQGADVGRDDFHTGRRAGRGEEAPGGC